MVNKSDLYSETIANFTYDVEQYQRPCKTHSDTVTCFKLCQQTTSRIMGKMSTTSHGYLAFLTAISSNLTF